MNGSAVQYQVRLTDDHICIRAPYSALPVCRAVGGGRWSRDWKCWVWPRREDYARKLLDAFGPKLASCDGGGSLADLVQPTEFARTIVDPGFVPGLKTTPWRHQREAYGFASQLPGAMLAMGMGTGKTLTAIGLSASSQKCIIICPKAVISVWPKEFMKHAANQPEFLVLNSGTGEAKAKALHTALLRPGRLVVVLNYESAWRDKLGDEILKHRWDCVLLDECLPTGTMIDTPSGPRPIESITVGDIVFGRDDATGRVVPTEVHNTFTSITNAPLVDVAGVLMTPNHPVYTKEMGYVPAGAIRDGSTVVLRAQDEGQAEVLADIQLRKVRSPVPPSQNDCGVLLQEVLLQFEVGEHASREEGGVHGQNEGDAQQAGCAREAQETPAFGVEPVSVPGGECPCSGYTASVRLQNAQRRQRNGDDCPTGGASCRARGRVDGGTHRPDQSQEGGRIPATLQAGHCAHGEPCVRGGGRELAPHHGTQGARQEEGRLPAVQGVDGNPGDEQAGYGPWRTTRRVHNIETGTGNYFACGLLVHNCHKIKAPGGKASKFCAKLRKTADRVIGLTGTPMPHSPLDIFAQYRAIAPHIFGTNFHLFKSRYAIMGGFGGHEVKGYRDQDELRQKFLSVAYQAGRDVIELPPATHTTIPVEMGALAQKVYRSLTTDLYAQLESGEVTAANALVKLLRLQQLTGGYLKLDDGSVQHVDSEKMDALGDLLEGMGDEPIIVFCRFRTDLDAVHTKCKELGLSSMELSGRVNQLADWQAGGAQVIAVQIQSGGVGVDLTRARYCVYYSLGFSLGDYEQSLARPHRPGQANPVSFYHLICTGTVDEHVYNALAERRDVVNTILEGIKRRQQ